MTAILLVSLARALAASRAGRALAGLLVVAGLFAAIGRGRA